MKKVYINQDKELKYYEIDLAVTTREYYEEERMMLIRNHDFGLFDDCFGHSFIIGRVYHCSCYELVDAHPEYIAYTTEELRKLANAKRDESYSTLERDFFELVRKFLGE